MTKTEQAIIQASREHFSEFGYYGARMDAISELSHVNKRLVYHFCHSKDELYMMVLSEVSREAMKAFEASEEWLGDEIGLIYGGVFNFFESHQEFLRLWAWERMSETIHGPRILETVNAIFEKIRHFVSTQLNKQGITIDEETFESIEALCHGHLLTGAMYLHCQPEMDKPEIGSEDASEIYSSPAYRRLNLSMHLQRMTLDSIEKLVCESHKRRRER